MSSRQRRRRLGAVVSVTSALLLVSPALMTGSAAAAEGGLEIGSRTSEKIRGSFRGDGSAVTFSSRRSAPESDRAYAQGHGLYGAPVAARMSVNGDEFRVRLNPRTRSIDWEASPGAVLSYQDKAAARAAMTRLATYLRAGDTPLKNQEALLMRSLAYAAEAPRGFELEDGGAQYAIECGHVGAGEAGTGGARTQSDTGIVLLRCDSSRNRTFHDALAHGRRSDVVRSGPASGIDRGRCGAAGSFLQLGWTQDCLDHDWCSEVHGSSLGPLDANCGDEFRDAVDDFLLTTPGECYRPEAPVEEREDAYRPGGRDPSKAEG